MNIFGNRAPVIENLGHLQKELSATYIALDDLLRGFDENRIDADKEVTLSRTDLIDSIRRLLNFKDVDSDLSRRKLLVNIAAVGTGAIAGSAIGFTAGTISEAGNKLMPGSVANKSTVLGFILGSIGGNAVYEKIIEPKIRPSALKMLEEVSLKFNDIDQLIEFTSKYSNIRSDAFSGERLESLSLILSTVVSIIDLEDRISASSKK